MVCLEEKLVDWLECAQRGVNEMERALQKIENVLAEVEKAIYGKRQVVQLTTAALIAGGHVLFEDVPGVGKTQMVKALAKTVASDFSRIQFTPDLLPSDILGVSIFNTRTDAFEFRQGPIFTDVLLADEINRTTPRTQAALLEAMSEKTVTIDGQTYPLSPHFFVLATQNPIDFEGTYPLPEAQLDRFLFKLNIGYPSLDDELKLVLNQHQQVSTIQQIIQSDELTELKELLATVYVDEGVAKYALALVQESRNHSSIALGISPRGSMAFIQGAKAYAMTEGRLFVTPEDIQTVLPHVFGHRIALQPFMEPQQLPIVLSQLLDQVPVPIRR